MAYTTTAREFFDNVFPALLKGSSAFSKVGGSISFNIEGDEGGSWYVNLDAGTVGHDDSPTDLIVRAQARDFMALVEGRMSPSDGLLTERLHVAGDMGRLSRLMSVLEESNLS
jgi:putative sterol carrier protein